MAIGQAHQQVGGGHSPQATPGSHPEDPPSSVKPAETSTSSGVKLRQREETH